MKFSCEKAILQNAITTAARAVSPKSSIPALEGLLLEAETLLAVTGYNLETGIRATIEAEIIKPGSLVLPARLFGDIIRKLPDDMISFSAEKLQVNIRCGPASFNLMAMDPDDFPLLPSVDYQHAFTISQRTLRAMISETLFAVSDNESRPIHTGSLFEVEPDALTVISVDGFRLALRREALHESEGSFQFVVPGAALSEVEKICKDVDDPVTVTMGARHILFRLEGAMLVSRRLEGEFLAWRKAIPRDNPIQIKADAKQLLTSIERVSLIISDKLKSPLRCTVGEGMLELSTRTSVSDATDTCPVEGDGGGLEIGFNNRYIMDALKAAPAESVMLEFNSGVSPCVITPMEGEEENFLYMILPVRLKAGE